MHATGIDAPLSVIRRGGPYGGVTLIPHSDYRGAYHVASLPSGGAYSCMPSQPCLYVVWPKKHWGSYWSGGDPASGDWAGSLIRGNQDVSGLMYRRNRYYDPSTGQFTQSDPIGIAGGLNTYGFAAGDPISFSDPFGLCAFQGDPGDKIQTRYAHLSVSCVSAGETVRKGQLIGFTGGQRGNPKSGTSTGPHLHFETRRIKEGSRNTTANSASDPMNPITTLQDMNGAAPVDNFDALSSAFGPRVHPVSGKLVGHAGVDVAVPVGTPVYAAQEGTVVVAGIVGGYGLAVYIDHPPPVQCPNPKAHCEIP